VEGEAWQSGHSGGAAMRLHVRGAMRERRGSCEACSVRRSRGREKR